MLNKHDALSDYHWRFYDLLSNIDSDRNNGRIPERKLAGVYFFFEKGETRTDSGTGDRVVRVGISQTLHHRLCHHLGSRPKSGPDHRMSRLRLLVGDALKRRDNDRWDRLDTWGFGSHLGAAAKKFDLDRNEIREREASMEKAVSEHIGAMSFCWVRVDDKSDRKFIEKNAIGLLSAPGCIAADPASPSWLGRHSSRKSVVRSGIWNHHHVGKGFDPGFLKTLEKHIT